jgi:hypothetical protein
MEWVRTRISGANLVVADLTNANPNVYLEVGYAWGKGVPTVLLVKSSTDLKFDVRGQRCIVYSSIKELEQKLSNELNGLIAERKPADEHGTKFGVTSCCMTSSWCRIGDGLSAAHRISRAF